MPFKRHEPRRHHIPKMKYWVTNWSEYDRGLDQSGDFRFWIDEEAMDAWIAPYRTIPGGQRKFSNFAIETTLTLGAVFNLPLRQTEGFVRSLMELTGHNLPVPDHTTLARRRRAVVVDMHAPGRKAPVDLVLDSTGLKFYGPLLGDCGQSPARQRTNGHAKNTVKSVGPSSRPLLCNSLPGKGRKLHIAMDAGTGEILAHELTNDDTSDPDMVTPLMEAAGGRIRRVFADGAYDGQPTYDAIRDASPPKSKPKTVINPRNTSIPDKGSPHGGSEREIHAAKIADVGQIAWQKETDYGLRSLGETAIGRVKSKTGGKLTARTFGAQKSDTSIQIAIANRAIRAAKPVSIRVS